MSIPSSSSSISCYRNAILGLTVFYLTFYSGGFWGYGPMQLLLERDYAFSYQCMNTNSSSSSSSPTNSTNESYALCDEQSNSLIRVQFIASIVAQIATPFFGAMLDSYGPFITTIFLTDCALLGLSLIVLSSMMQVSSLLYIAFLLLGGMAMTSVPLIMSTAYTLFHTERSQSRVITLLNTVYECGSGFDYWVLYQSAKVSGSSLVHVISMYLGLAILVFPLTVFFWYLVTQRLGDYTKQENLLSYNNNKDDSSFQQDKDYIINTVILTNGIDSSLSSKASMNTPSHTPSYSTYDSIEKIDKHSITSSSDYDPTTTTATTTTSTYWDEMKSQSFWILTILFSIHCSRINFILTTSRDFLRSLGDDATGNQYLSILSWTSPLALLGLPLVDYILETYGYPMGLQCINLIAIIHGLVMCFGNLQVQIVGFVLLAMYHCFLFGIVFSFLGVLVSNHVIGRLSGIISAVGGIVQLINIPLGQWAVLQLKGNFFWPNFLYIIAVLPCIYGVYRISREEKVTKL